MPGFELIGEEERAALNELMDEGGVYLHMVSDQCANAIMFGN